MRVDIYTNRYFYGKPIVEIDEGRITVSDAENLEITHWDEFEWIENPALVYEIADVIKRCGSEDAQSIYYGLRRVAIAEQYKDTAPLAAVETVSVTSVETGIVWEYKHTWEENGKTKGT